MNMGRLHRSFNLSVDFSTQLRGDIPRNIGIFDGVKTHFVHQGANSDAGDAKRVGFDYGEDSDRDYALLLAYPIYVYIEYRKRAAEMDILAGRFK